MLFDSFTTKLSDRFYRKIFGYETFKKDRFYRKIFGYETFKKKKTIIDHIGLGEKAPTKTKTNIVEQEGRIQTIYQLY